MIKNTDNTITVSRQVKIEFPICFINGVFSEENSTLSSLCVGKSILIVMDKNIASLYKKSAHDYFSWLANIQADFFEIDALEPNKTLDTVINICSKAKQIGLKRNSLIIGIGGGVLLDMVGLAATIFRRKIDYIRIPTTLIGIVDAGIGIKVGVNFENSKNFLGHFYAPLAVFNDQSFLQTLPQQEIRCGLFEIVKMAIIKSEYLFQLLEKNYIYFLEKRFSNSTESINRLAIQLMLEELEPNLFERDLKRLVDFGHAFSSYIESSSNYAIPHGMAVGIDMLLSSHIANQKGLLKDTDFSRIVNLFQLIGLNGLPEGCTPEQLHQSLEDIRKHRAGNLNLPLPIKIGKAIFSNDCTLEEVEEAVEFINGLNKNKDR